MAMSCTGFDPRTFWDHFESERHHLANCADALRRGEQVEADPVQMLNDWLKGYDRSVRADLSETEFGRRLLIIAGPNEASLAALLHAAPAFPGWRYRCEPARAA